MKITFDLNEAWYYSVTENPSTNGDRFLLRIYFKKELKHQVKMGYRIGRTRVANLIEKKLIK